MGWDAICMLEAEVSLELSADAAVLSCLADRSLRGGEDEISTNGSSADGALLLVDKDRPAECQCADELKSLRSVGRDRADPGFALVFHAMYI